MQTVRTFALVSAVVISACTLLPAGCGKEPDPAAPAAGGAKPARPDAHAHADGDAHDHADGDAHDHADDRHHGETTRLGEQTVGGFTLRASRDGEIVPGKEAAIDVWVTGGPKVVAVRFWIGTQDGRGSVKARAELEKDNWHTHAEVPSPLPEGSRLWVEVEAAGGEIVVAGFDLKLN